VNVNRVGEILAILLFCVACGCASSGGSLEKSTTCDTSSLRMWSVVQAVVSWMGGRVVVADQNGGMLVATLPIEDLGTEVRLYVEITGSPGGGIAFLNSVTVTVKAVDPRVTELDEYRSDFLEYVEKRFLEEVAARAPCLESLK